VSLSYEDVQEILRLLDNSPYDELNLQTDSFNLYLKRSEDNTGWSQEIQTLKTLRENTGQPGTMKPADKMPATTQASEPPATEPDLLDIRAPMVGTFYRAPKPGAEPFVDIGSEVEEHTVIAIIEVMKLMSSIPAAMSGEIREIVAQDAQFVEKGQLLMRIKPGSP
jgi:acetyl-CoA carboxylase biotin carboxyl carrier protein